MNEPATYRPDAVNAGALAVGQRIGLKKEEWERISGHSARVGAARALFDSDYNRGVSLTS